MFKRIVSVCAAGFALLACSVAVEAQALEPNAIVNGGAQVLKLIDEGKAGEVWDGASPVAQRVIPREQFVASVQKARQTRGAVVGRDWLSVTRLQATATKDLPAGNYVTLLYSTRFAGGLTLKEQISFRYDEPTWRVVGYVLDDSASAK